MGSPALLPALAIVAGAACGIPAPSSLPVPLWPLAVLVSCAAVAFAARRWRVLLTAALAASFWSGFVLAADASEHALYPSLRLVLDQAFGGFSIDSTGPAGQREPVQLRAVVAEDAWRADNATIVRARVRSIWLEGRWRNAEGGVTLSIAGTVSASRAIEWSAGREIEAPVTFRRPARYLNEGVPDFEQDLALSGTTLYGSVKSGLLVVVQGQGSRIEEIAAGVRSHIRRAVGRFVGSHDPVSAAIVTAILIGDRTGLPDDIRLRLQAAGTYHVIAISGGNIAILAGAGLGLLMALGWSGRGPALVTLLLLVAYAQVTNAGPSVWRATVMAVLYLVARLFDHRSLPRHALAVAAMVIVCAHPLDVRDAGFLLTFGAAMALLEVGRRVPSIPWGGRARLVLVPVIASVTASCAVETALLPISAMTFSRVTAAGLLLNLLAVPLMGVTQMAGMIVVCASSMEHVARVSGWVAHIGAASLVFSAKLVDTAPWLTARVPPPPGAEVVAYYTLLGIAIAASRWIRIVSLAGLGIVVMAIVSGTDLRAVAGPRGAATHADSAHLPEPPHLRLTVFDVGQGDAMLLQLPDGSTLMVDTGGAPFGGGTFDVGSRVLAPALWARRVRRLDRLLLTHGDPDHIGGAGSLIDDFHPGRLWEGVPVPGHTALGDVLDRARHAGSAVARHLAGDRLDRAGITIRVLHPPVPDWERQKVRNDDSVVLEVIDGDVALLLTGDIGASVERAIVPLLTPARIRVLKVAHHGSRTSSSRELLEGWRPQVAVISCGRGNSFGHPAPEVIERLQAIHASVYRTDTDGQITIDSDGHDVRVRTYVGDAR